MSAAAQAPASLLWVHGWGFDAHCWDAVRALLPARWQALPHTCADAGYLGAALVAIRPAATPYVAIGHSHGVQQLLQTGLADCVGLVSVSGFPRFAAAEDWPAGTPARLLARMRMQFDRQPLAVWRDFRSRCGVPWRGTDAPTLALPALADGLRALAEDDAREALAQWRGPLCAISAEDDAIVPPALAHAAFGDRLVSVPEGAHALPLTRPDLCARHIGGFLDTLAVAP
ncbi:Biotin synthesis protein BioH [plant metagenome]